MYDYVEVEQDGADSGGGGPAGGFPVDPRNDHEDQAAIPAEDVKDVPLGTPVSAEELRRLKEDARSPSEAPASEEAPDEREADDEEE